MEVFLTYGLIYISSKRGYCEINHLNIDNNRFHSKLIEDSMIEVDTSNFILNNLIIKNCYLKTRLFYIQFIELGSISNVDIYSISNDELLSDHYLFKIKGLTLFI